MLGQVGLRAGLSMEVGKWVRNVAFATHAILGRARRQKRGRVVREVGREAKSSKTKRQKETKHKEEGVQGKGKGDSVEKI